MLFAMSSSELDALSRLLNSTMVRLLRLARKADRKAPVGPAQLSALSVLYFSGAMSATALAEAEQIAQPTMSRIVASLLEAGAIERAPHPSDARSQLISPTALGRKIFEDAREERLKVVRAVAERLPSTTAALLQPALADLLDAIEADRRGA